MVPLLKLMAVRNYIKQQAFHPVERFLSHLGKKQVLKYCQTHPAEWKLQFFSSCTDVESMVPTRGSIHKDTTGTTVFLFFLKDARSSSLLFAQSLPTDCLISDILSSGFNPIQHPESNGYFIFPFLYKDTIMEQLTDFLTMVFFSHLFFPYSSNISQACQRQLQSEHLKKVE